MRTWFLVSFILLSTSLFAAQTKPITRFSNPETESLNQYVKREVVPRGSFGDCGFSLGYQVVSRKYNEYTSSIIKEMMAGWHITGVQFLELKPTEASLQKILAFLSSASGRAIDGDVAHRFLDSMAGFFSRGQSRYLYLARYTNQENNPFAVVGVWDRSAEQILLFGNGRCY